MKKLFFCLLLILVLVGCNQTNNEETFEVLEDFILLYEKEGISIPITYSNISEDRINVTFSNDDVLEFNKEKLSIKAKKYGFTRINVEVMDSDYKATIDVYVESKNVITPILQSSNRDIRVNNPFKIFFANSDKVGASIESFNFTLNDDSLAEIDSNLVITPKKTGLLTITATQKFNTEITSSFEVNIVDENYDSKFIITTKDNIFSVKPGEYLELIIDGKRVNMEDNYIFSSYYTDFASITADGRVVGIKNGIGYFGVTSKTSNKTGVIYLEINGEENKVDYIERLIEIALAEKGYKEQKNGWTKYGEWYDQLYKLLDWCAMFVAWSANEAGIPTTVIPRLAKVEFIKNFYERQNRFEYREDGYIPKRGDIIIFEDTSHVGIVTGVSNQRVYTIEGNTSNQVAERNYSLTDTYILGYGLPDYNKLNY